MKKNILIAVVMIILIVGGIATYFYWQHVQSKPEAVRVAAPPSVVPTKPLVKHVIVTPPVWPGLPKLSKSDTLMLNTLDDLLHDKTLIILFYKKQIIHKIVATIDNLPRRRIPISVLPIKQAPDQLITERSESDEVISPQNTERYLDYMRIVEVIGARKLVEVYVLFYPLFQQAYEELGYPKKYFNDRLLLVLDDLLAAPDLNDPVKLIRQNVFYLYADRDLETRSAGQKILMRIGSENESIIKAKLREIKQQVRLHMRNRKVSATE